MVAAWAGFGLHRLEMPFGPAPGVSVVLVQGNVEQTDKWDRTIAQTVFDRYLDLTRKGVAEAQAGAPGSRIVVVWPETASPYLIGRYPEVREMMAAAARPAIAIIAGSIRLDDGGEPYNTAFALTGDGTVAATYDKWHLVPFGEFAPSWVPFSVKIVPGTLGFGNGPKTIHLPGVPPFGPFICYEAIYPAQIVDEADRPEWLVNITNDAWFGNSTGPRQHLEAARLRAVEEGLPLFRAANTGITAAFDAAGHELARLPPRVAGEMVVALPGDRGPTSFARRGLAIPLLLSLGACLAGLGVVRRRTRRPSCGVTLSNGNNRRFFRQSLTACGCVVNDCPR